ncbi:MAG: exodeoxyribonuclease I, partial [Colwellia sp.]|nr:exodeoxyribonuclease I [Colwellia sp.]
MKNKENKITQSDTLNQPSILWHDYETWGISPKFDKPSQFAGIRTDLDLNIIGEPEMFYCQPPQDYLPQPEACLVTGITPQKAQRDGLSEAEFASRVHALFSQPDTCVAGYNNIRFDDEVSRYLFYRNFYDPYGREWQNGNSRWDIIDLVRACYALRPEGIEWPTVERDGKQVVSFRLELLTQANGISHEAAHDAMSDVYATIAMAKLIKEKQPKLYDFIFNLKNKRQVAELIDVYNMTPIVHTSSKVSSDHGCTSWFAPIAYHPTNKNAVIAVDLARDPTPLFELTSDEIKERLYTRYDDLAADELPIPVKLIHINKCPVVAPAKTLLPENAKRLNIPRELCLKHLSLLKSHDDLRDKLSDVFSNEYDNSIPVDPE